MRPSDARASSARSTAAASCSPIGRIDDDPGAIGRIAQAVHDPAAQPAVGRGEARRPRRDRDAACGHGASAVGGVGAPRSGRARVAGRPARSAHGRPEVHEGVGPGARRRRAGTAASAIRLQLPSGERGRIAGDRPGPARAGRSYRPRRPARRRRSPPRRGPCTGRRPAAPRGPRGPRARGRRGARRSREPHATGSGRGGRSRGPATRAGHRPASRPRAPRPSGSGP